MHPKNTNSHREAKGKKWHQMWFDDFYWTTDRGLRTGNRKLLLESPPTFSQLALPPIALSADLSVWESLG